MPVNFDDLRKSVERMGLRPPEIPTSPTSDQNAPTTEPTSVPAPTETPEIEHTTVSASATIHQLSSHKPPCGRCLDLAHRGMAFAHGLPESGIRRRWEEWAMETFSYAYTHPKVSCNNRTYLFDGTGG